MARTYKFNNWGDGKYFRIKLEHKADLRVAFIGMIEYVKRNGFDRSVPKYQLFLQELISQRGEEFFECYEFNLDQTMTTKIVFFMSEMFPLMKEDLDSFYGGQAG